MPNISTYTLFCASATTENACISGHGLVIADLSAVSAGVTNFKGAGIRVLETEKDLHVPAQARQGLDHEHNPRLRHYDALLRQMPSVASEAYFTFSTTASS